MKASEMICLLAKQIEMNGDRDIELCINICISKEYGEYDDVLAKALSVTWDEDKKTIEIYGE